MSTRWIKNVRWDSDGEGRWYVDARIHLESEDGEWCLMGDAESPNGQFLRHGWPDSWRTFKEALAEATDLLLNAGLVEPAPTITDEMGREL